MVWSTATAPPTDWASTFFPFFFLSSECGYANTGSLTGLFFFFLNFWPFNDALRPCLLRSLIRLPQCSMLFPQQDLSLFYCREEAIRRECPLKPHPHSQPYSPPLFCEERKLPSSCPHPHHASDSSHHLLHLSSGSASKSSVGSLISEQDAVSWLPGCYYFLIIEKKNVRRDNRREFHSGSSFRGFGPWSLGVMLLGRTVYVIGE